MVTALILAGGKGTRLGSDIPKQYIEVNKKPILSYCLDVFVNHKGVDKIRIVADEMWHGYIFEFIKSDKFSGYSLPGETRQLSIYNGISDIMKTADEKDIVVIHDGARPNISEKLLSECINAVKGHDGSLPVLPMKDTVYISEDGKKVTSLIQREKIYAGQAPEAFVIGKYFDANKRLLPDEILKINGSTEPAIMAGMDIALIDGDENNFKITTKSDLEKFKEIMKI